MQDILGSIQQTLYDRALGFRQAHTQTPQDYSQFCSAVEEGFALSYWCGDSQCEARIKQETKATLRCIPLEQCSEAGTCICCGQAATEQAIFAKAY